jgi:hypothetical protein
MLFSVYRVRYALAALVLARLLVAGSQAPEIVGRWRSLETSSTGLGSMLTFHSNGVVEFSPGAVVEMTYRTEGGQMIFPPATINGPEQLQKMEFVKKDQLQLADVVFTRQGSAPDANHLILGEWVGKREMNGRRLEARYFFYPAGKCLLVLPLTTSPGQYTIQGSTMRLELPDQQPAEGKFQIEGDVLTTPGRAARDTGSGVIEPAQAARTTTLRHRVNLVIRRAPTHR